MLPFFGMCSTIVHDFPGKTRDKCKKYNKMAQHLMKLYFTLFGNKTYTENNIGKKINQQITKGCTQNIAKLKIKQTLTT